MGSCGIHKADAGRKEQLPRDFGTLMPSSNRETCAAVRGNWDELTPALESSKDKCAPGYVSLGFPDPLKPKAIGGDEALPDGSGWLG